jgi:hypothetical protein
VLDKLVGDHKAFAALYSRFKQVLEEHPQWWTLHVKPIDPDDHHSGVKLQVLSPNGEAHFMTHITPQCPEGANKAMRSLQGHIATIEAQTLTAAQAKKQQKPSLLGQLVGPRWRWMSA